MNKFIFKSGDRIFYVVWDGLKMFANNGTVRVLEGDRLLGEFVSMEDIKAGKMFKTSDGLDLRVVYEKVFWFISAIRVEFNGQKLKGAMEINQENYNNFS